MPVFVLFHTQLWNLEAACVHLCRFLTENSRTQCIAWNKNCHVRRVESEMYCSQQTGKQRIRRISEGAFVYNTVSKITFYFCYFWSRRRPFFFSET